jgi:hypothetical protein
MVIIETSVFTRRITELIDDDEYRFIQKQLLDNPLKGALIRKSGGMRKLRWRVKGRGKRGGLRVIYYWMVGAKHMYMLYVYPKSEQEDLTPEQLKTLKRILEE